MSGLVVSSGKRRLPKKSKLVRTESLPVRLGSLVRPSDLRNYGKVVKIMPTTATVRFQSPTTGSIAYVEFPHTELEVIR